jgi:5-methylcytosine-specific restriction endonuclease McrA
MNLLLQPYARPSKTKNDNYLITITNKFDLLKAVNNSSSKTKPDLSEFLLAHPDGKAKIWALGENSNSKSVYSKIKVGDLVLFHGDKLIYGYGVISSKTIWLKNNYIWPSGENWDYIYSLNDFVEIPVGSRVTRESLRQLCPKVGHLSAFFIDLESVGISQGDVIRHLQVTPPYVNAKNVISVTRGPENPPILGERFKDRKTIWKAFGGQWQQGIVTFPGEKIVNAFSDENGPYPDYRDPETGVIEYRGQGLTGEQRLILGNKLLEDARLSKEPVRYWHRPSGESWIFDSWVVVADRSIVIEEDINSVSSRRILWFLIPIDSPVKENWPLEIKDAPVLNLADVRNEEPKKLKDLLKDYQKISSQLELEIAGKIISSSPRTQYKRRKEARDLVIARSKNSCEYDKCTGMPPDVNRQGLAILQVDHIVALAEGGPDIPSNMIALCPNCHGAKTYGLHSEKMSKRFQLLVQRKEELLR